MSTSWVMSSASGAVTDHAQGEVVDAGGVALVQPCEGGRGPAAQAVDEPRVARPGVVLRMLRMCAPPDPAHGPPRCPEAAAGLLAAPRLGDLTPPMRQTLPPAADIVPAARLRRRGAFLPTHGRSPASTQGGTMKKLIVVALVAVAVLVFCAPAHGLARRAAVVGAVAHFTCVGKIQAVDTAASTVTVRVHLASRGAADYLGEDLTVAVAADAQRLQGRRRALRAHRPGRPGRRGEAARGGRDRLLERHRRVSSASVWSCVVCPSTTSGASPSAVP